MAILLRNFATYSLTSLAVFGLLKNEGVPVLDVRLVFGKVVRSNVVDESRVRHIYVGDELASDSYPTKVVDDIVIELDGKTICVTNAIDESLIGGKSNFASILLESNSSGS